MIAPPIVPITRGGAFESVVAVTVPDTSLPQPAIQDLNPAVRCDLDVSRFQIAVNDPFLVCGFSRRTHGGVWSRAWEYLFRVRKSKMPMVLYGHLDDLSIIGIIDGEAITINEGRSRAAGERYTHVASLL